MQDRPILRPATPEDGLHMARLVDMAGHGLPRASWAAMAPESQDPLAFGASRAQRETGGFSYRNTRMLQIGDEVAGMLITYRLPAEPQPLDGIPPLARPLQELENLCPGSLYINAIALYPPFRRRGLGMFLLDQAGEGPQALITGSNNAAALALYRRAGFEETARRRAVGDALWQPGHAEWVLLTRPDTRQAQSACT